MTVRARVGRGGTRGWLAAAAALVLGAAPFFACSQTPPPKPAAACDVQSVTLSVIGSPRTNPTLDGEPRPVQIRLYQLKSDLKLQNAEFEKVWLDEKAALGDDLLKADELTAFPDSRTEVRFERDNAASNLVAVALFRSPKGRSWFTSYEFPPPPGKEACGAVCGDECEGGSVQNPRYALWVDGTKVEDGAEHEGDRPDGGRITQLTLGMNKANEPRDPVLKVLTKDEEKKK